MARTQAEPAFPDPMRGGSMIGHQQEPHPGMSLRDYFAAQAMQALLDPAFATAMLDRSVRDSCTIEFSCASRAYEYADAMMKARDR